MPTPEPSREQPAANDDATPDGTRKRGPSPAQPPTPYELAGLGEDEVTDAEEAGEDEAT